MKTKPELEIIAFPTIDPNNFWDKVIKTDTCWIWKGCTRNGYGRMHITINNKSYIISVHRFSYYLHFGVFPGTSLVLHKCDNPPCICPDHIFLGSHKDNAIDVVKKGRFNKATGNKTNHKNAPKGENHHATKLTKSQVIEIRNLLYRGLKRGDQTKLAKKYKVSHQVINRIVHNKSWDGIIGC
jgi:HNH endonuclease